MLGYNYVIKAKKYPTLVSQVMEPLIVFVTGEEGREITELETKQNTWNKDRKFVISRVSKPEKDREQLSLIDGDEYEYFFLCDQH